MGEVKRSKLTFEERKARAIAAGRIKEPKVSEKVFAKAALRDFEAILALAMTQKRRRYGHR